MNEYLNGYVLWGGIPTRRVEIYKWMQGSGARFMGRVLDQPTMDEADAESLLAAFVSSGVSTAAPSS